MRRLVAGCRRGAVRRAPDGEDGDADPDAADDDRAGDQDPSGVAQLGDGSRRRHRDDVPGGRLARLSARRGAPRTAIRPGAGRARSARPRPRRRSGGSSGPTAGGVRSGAVDGLVEAFGRRAGWQFSGPPTRGADTFSGCLTAEPTRAARRSPSRRAGQVAQRAVQEDPRRRPRIVITCPISRELRPSTNRSRITWRRSSGSSATARRTRRISSASSTSPAGSAFGATRSSHRAAARSGGGTGCDGR